MPDHDAGNAPHATAQRSNAGYWVHDDGTPCPTHWSTRSTASDGQTWWWCTEHQQHVHIEDREAEHAPLTDEERIAVYAGLDRDGFAKLLASQTFATISRIIAARIVAAKAEARDEIAEALFAEAERMDTHPHYSDARASGYESAGHFVQRLYRPGTTEEAGRG